MLHCHAQGEDDWQHLLHDLSSSPTLPESTALIWGSSEEVGAEARPDSSCSGSILQPDSPSGDSTRVSGAARVGGWGTNGVLYGSGLQALTAAASTDNSALSSNLLISNMAAWKQCHKVVPKPHSQVAHAHIIYACSTSLPVLQHLCQHTTHAFHPS